MTTPSWDLLRDLAGFCSDTASALSFYAGLDPSESPTPRAVSTRFNSLLAEVERAHVAQGERGPQTKAVRAGLERVRAWSRDFDRQGVRGVAVFVSTDDDVWRVVTTPAPVADHVEVDRQFALAPLVPLVRTGEQFVALMDRERGLVFRVVDGRLEEVVDESGEVPGQHDQGGWSQARYQRHIEHLVQAHLKDVGGELDDSIRRARGARLVIVAPDELRGEIEAKLSSETLDAVVGWAHAEPHATPAELYEVVRPILERAREKSCTELLERWRERLGRNGRAAEGWPDTLEAASDGRVELLLAVPNGGRPGYRCPECLRAAAEPGACPLHGAGLEEHDAYDLAVHRTLLHGGSVLSFGERRDGLESVGALLRF